MLPVVEAGAFDFLFVEGKAERFDEVQSRADREACATGVAGVPVDFGIDENDMKHRTCL